MFDVQERKGKQEKSEVMVACGSYFSSADCCKNCITTFCGDGSGNGGGVGGDKQQTIWQSQQTVCGK